MGRQVIVGGSSAGVSTGAIRYTSLMGNNYTWISSDVGVRQRSPTYANLYYLRVYLTTAPGAGKSYTFTLYVQGSDTPMSVTISGADTTGQDMGHAVALVPNDRISLKCTPSGTPAASTARWSIVSESVIPGETILIGNTPQNFNAALGFYALVGSTFYHATEFRREILIPTAGTLTKFYVVMNAQPGAGGDNYRFIIRKNTVSTALDITLTDSQTAGNDQDAVAVAAGDAICLAVIRGGPSPVQTQFGWGLVFIPDTDGEFVIPMSSDDQPATNEYAQLTSGDETYSGTRADHQQLASEMTIKRIYAEKDSANAFPKGWQFTLESNGGLASPLLQVKLLTANSLNSASADVVIADDDLLDTVIGQIGLGTVAKYVHVSYLGYIAPAPSRAVDFGANF